ncbi:MAG TPA: methyltransferase domain-containing protein [Bacteroidales bacterium]
MKFSSGDVADYYDQTLNHYQKWWHLNDSLAVHYGFWKDETKSFVEALQNTNHFLAEMANIQEGIRILDAGCGVGGSAFYLAENHRAKVTGITLSEKQLAFANRKLTDLKLDNYVDFRLENYVQTSFPDNTFDLIWAIESITSAPDKAQFATESYRILKPGGKLIIADYFATAKKDDPKNWLEKWRQCWSMALFLEMDVYREIFEGQGLKFLKQENITKNIFPSALKMYRAYLLGALPSILYNAFHNTSRFAKTHYKSGKYQYEALKAELWEYRVLLFEKQ